MCNGNCVCGKNENNVEDDINNDEIRVAHDHGYVAGFIDARQLFWAELRTRAGDARLIANKLKESGNEIDSEAFSVAEATYFTAAEAILRGRRDFPGYMEDGEDPSDSWRDQDDEESFESCSDDGCNCN